MLPELEPVGRRPPTRFEACQHTVGEAGGCHGGLQRLRAEQDAYLLPLATVGAVRAGEVNVYMCTLGRCRTESDSAIRSVRVG